MSRTPRSALPIETSGPLQGRTVAPPSKSITNRALLLAGLANGTSRLSNVLDAEDTRVMSDALAALGVTIRRLDDGVLSIRGCAGVPSAATTHLSVGNAGTAMRFLAAAVTLGTGTYELDGDARMRQRPLGGLVDALVSLGASARYRGKEGFPPVEITGGPLAGGSTRLDAGSSSQFLSALLMVGPCTSTGLEIERVGRAVSLPYVDLTLELMRQFGGPSIVKQGDVYRVPGGGGYRGTEMVIEGDASSAASLFAAAAVSGGKLRVQGLPANSKQPDLEFLRLLERMGCTVTRDGDTVEVRAGALRGIEADVSACPDVAPVLAAVALFGDGTTRIHGAPHLRVKESDRIGDLAHELRRLGADIDEHEDGLTIRPVTLRGAPLNPHRDHRLAMAFGIIGLVVQGVAIEDASCVGKSFPGFFDVLDSLRP